ncbi:hypothetical protein [Ornithinibacillus halophilus]|uniref:Uncharacterized protein n=1 Tax=Ornithinibacillus halophilus TaxID=930117 RepID=A0A1M5MZ21_9BACI|nr:hypothetical protein [Ornithinibacillus halophilus]SHG82465.1 hypothetical protein SAMN05216225_10684 [Ornithinibacillus halophilus]
MTWNEINNKKDIDVFMETFGGFHDSCLKELHMSTDSFVGDELGMAVPLGLDTKVRILFQKQSRNPSAIELYFEEVTEMHIHPRGENQDSIIYDATLIQRDGLFYWADEYGWDPDNYTVGRNSWIAAKKVKWRDVSSWMGQTNRYGVISEDET